jgi:ribosomal protein L30
MSGKAPAEAGRLVITLVRGLAGKRQVYKDTCQVLGLNKTWRKTEKPNNASVRGMVQKVGTAIYAAFLRLPLPSLPFSFPLPHR